MNDWLSVAAALLAGVSLGAFFFGGLWWTVRKGVASESPALWFLSSLVLRMSITLAGFLLVGQGDWRRWLACLAGFSVARLAAWWLTQAPVRPEANYAP